MSEKLAEFFPVLVLWTVGWVLPASVLALVFVHLRRHGYLRPFAGLFRAARQLSLIGWFCIAPLVVGLVGYASIKDDGGNTNDTPAHMSAPRRLMRSWADGWLIPQTPVTPAEIAAGYRAPAFGPAGIVPAPEGAVTNVRWRMRGAHDDAFRPALEDWRFPVRDGAVTGVTVLARGEVRPDVGTLYFPVPITNGVSLLPAVKWGELFHAEAQSRGDASVFWHGMTPSNSLLLTWENALAGRDPDCPTNLQAELFADGRFAWRTDDASQLYLPVLDFDWDGDGLENSVDPDPFVAGPDAHGTNAEWYKVVCTNVFTEAVASGEPDPDEPADPCLLPEGIEFRGNVTSNAYYFVDVVAERGPAPIYFMGDQGGFIGAPVVVARAGELNHVPLQIGVEYAVTSSVPFSLTLPMDGSAEILKNEPCEKTVKWPITFSVATEDDGHTVVVTPCSSGMGGEYHWRRPSEGDEAEGPQARNAPSGSECSYSANGGRVTFNCGNGGCSCQGCWIVGNFVTDGVTCDLPTVWCGCSDSHGEEDDDPPPTTPHGDMASAPSVSATFDHPVVIFENAYTNAPGACFPRHSKTVTLRISAYGGVNGSRLDLSKVGIDERLVQTGGHRFPTKAVKIPADSDVNYEFIFEGKAESESSKDIKVVATLTAINAMSPEPETAELTAVRVAIRPDHVTAPMYRNRHLFGVCEKVRCESWPESMSVSWSGGVQGTAGSTAAYYLHEAPFEAKSYNLVASAGGVDFPCVVESILPSEVKAYNDNAHEVEILGCYTPTNEAGWVGMKLHIYCSPTNVYFGEIQVRELDADGDVNGYFASSAWKGGRDHRGAALSDEWMCPGDGNYIGIDEASIDGCPAPWGGGGSLTWNIPNACRGVVGDEFSVCVYSHSPQVFTITSNGVVEVTKFGAHVRRYPILGAEGIYWRGNED